MKKKHVFQYGILYMVMALGLMGCSNVQPVDESETGAIVEEVDSEVITESSYEAITTNANITSNGAIDATDLFTERDLTQNVNLSGATSYTVSDNQDITINEEGAYVFSGKASNVSIIVEADDTAKVQLVLDGLTISNDSDACIYVKSADKVFVTTTEGSTNTLTVSGTFQADGDTNVDGVIFSKDDITLNGLGTLVISSSDNGIVGKDDVKVTGGTYQISATSKAIQANDSIRIADGTFTLKAGTDGLHAENTDDPSLGYIYICGGSMEIQANDDGIHATTIFQIDDGNLVISAYEAIEATVIQLNGGTMNIYASDDAINAAHKSTAYSPYIEINGGDITIQMAQGDTDAIDSNGNITMNGGTVNISAQSSFDYDGQGVYNGGTLIINGQEVNYLPNQMMGGGPNGGFGEPPMGGGGR